VVKKKTYLLGESRQEFTDKEAKEAFLAYMNKKATDIGMQNTTFVDAAGFYNRTTAYDLLKLAVYATAYDDLVDAWHKNTYTITVNGKSPRNVSMTTTVASAYLEDYYFLFGGKTGTVDGQSNLLCIVEGPDERLFACVVLGTSINRFQAAKQALDAAMIKYYDHDADNSNYTVEAKSAAVCIVPKHNTLAYTDYPLTMLYEKDIYTSRTPASITKVMTAICMLDFVADINESMIIKQNDLTAGSGYYFYDGDIITYRESLHAMMLPSSNTAAEATATAVGHKILDYASR
jgi:D-alanyl-D-alanine carboxypeptidase